MLLQPLVYKSSMSRVSLVDELGAARKIVKMALWNVNMEEGRSNEDEQLEVQESDVRESPELEDLQQLNRVSEELDESSEDDEAIDNGQPEQSTPLRDEPDDVMWLDRDLDTPPLPGTPLAQLLFDDAPPPYTPPYSMPSMSDVCDVSEDDISEASAPAGVQVVYVPIPDVHLWDSVQINSWRARSSGLTWNLIRAITIRGHAGTNPAILRHLHESLPMVNNNPASISVTIVVIQTIATIGHADLVFRFWAQQEGRALPPLTGWPTARLDPIQPWNIDSWWGYDLWSLVSSSATPGG